LFWGRDNGVWSPTWEGDTWNRLIEEKAKKVLGNYDTNPSGKNILRKGVPNTQQRRPCVRGDTGNDEKKTTRTPTTPVKPNGVHDSKRKALAAKKKPRAQKR